MRVNCEDAPKEEEEKEEGREQEDQIIKTTKSVTEKTGVMIIIKSKYKKNRRG